MSKGERYAIIATIAVAALISGPWFYTQLLVWKAEGHDHMLTVGNIVITVLLWAVLVYGILRASKSGKRAENLDAAIITARGEHETQTKHLRSGKWTPLSRPILAGNKLKLRNQTVCSHYPVLYQTNHRRRRRPSGRRARRPSDVTSPARAAARLPFQFFHAFPVFPTPYVSAAFCPSARPVYAGRRSISQTLVQPLVVIEP